MTNIQQILVKYWGYTHFRPMQEEIIRSVLEGKDTLALLPTGGGKSICFQVPAMAGDGVCIVVSPLIALMKDQVENLQKRDIKAVAITSAMRKNEVDIALDNCIYGKTKFLYLSPERLQSELVQTRISKMNVNLIAVDEAHCISQWGYDFRPSYLQIAQLRELAPNAPVLALTATATPEVVEDIQEQLHFKESNVLRKSFERKNLAYVVIQEDDKQKKLLDIARNVPGSGVVYATSRKKTQEIAAFLKKHNIAADYYHAGLEPQVRSTKQDQWIKDQIRIIVSTNAFGMGIDKANVRFVVHYDLPSSLEAYFQEAGRAGRDQKKAYAVLLYNNADKIELEDKVLMSFPEPKEIKNVYQALANYYQLAIGSGAGTSFDFDIADFCHRYDLNGLTAFNSLKFLEKEGYLYVTDALFQPSRIHFSISHEELYKFQVANTAYDAFIKLLLRSYSGSFDDYVKINETELAKRFNCERPQVVKYLNTLQQHQVIAYLPQTSLPQVVFTQERIATDNLFISPKHLSERKEKAVERMEWVVHYAGSDHKCRSQLLLSYFGEKDSYRCGICDVCLERNKLDLNNVEFEQVSGQIKKLLEPAPLPLTEIVNHIHASREDKTIKVIQWLIDNDKLRYNEMNQLYWNK